jgi:uncharacterized protein (TIRG00374 family)
MGAKPSEKGNDDAEPFRISFLPLFVSLAVLISVSVAVILRFGDFDRFLLTAKRAEPWWLVVAVVLQSLTYVSTGEVWNVVAREAKRTLGYPLLMRLAIERHTVDQCVPSAGVAGHAGTLQSLRHSGLPAPVAMEAVLVDLVSHYIAYFIAAAAAFVALSIRSDVSSAISFSIAVFVFISVAILAVSVLFLRNPDLIRKIPAWLSRKRPVAKLLSVFSRISADRVLHPRIVAEASFFQAAVFFLDAATLWAVLRSVGAHASFSAVFIAFVIALIVGTVTFIPGGIGAFEAGAVTVLLGFGVPLEGTLAGVFLFRGLTLWIPIFPGLAFVHRELVSFVSFGGRSGSSSGRAG